MKMDAATEDHDEDHRRTAGDAMTGCEQPHREAPETFVYNAP